MQALKRTFGFLNRHPIAKRNKLNAYFKFLTWQLRSRMQRNKLHVIPFVENTKFIACRNLTGITGSIYTGLHDFEEMSFLLHFLREEDCFFDVGANVGAYTILASGIRRCKSIAFEPNITTFGLLKKNIALNNLADLVQCEIKGVGSESGKIKFTAGGGTTNHVISGYEQEAPFVEVDLVLLDNYKVYPSLIKIDVEGFETEVIKGAESILNHQNLKAIIIELNGSGGRYGFDEQNIHEKLLQHGFAPFTYEPFSRTLSRLESFGLYNTIYVRDIEYVSDRVKKSREFTVWNTDI